MVARNSGKPSSEIQSLADRAAQLYRKDKKSGEVKTKFKDYIERVLTDAGLLTDDRVRQITRILGSRGGMATAKGIRAGIIKPKQRKRSTGNSQTLARPRRFRETLWPEEPDHTRTRKI
jgi:hypothetical protein